MSKNIGKIVQILGPVVDVRFEKSKIPAILNALELKYEGNKYVFEVARKIFVDGLCYISWYRKI